MFQLRRARTGQLRPANIRYAAGAGTGLCRNGAISELGPLSQLEATYQPAFGQNTLNNLNQMLMGSPGGTTQQPQTNTVGQSGWYDATGNYLGNGSSNGSSNGGMLNAQFGVSGGSGSKSSFVPPAGAVYRNKGDTYTTSSTVNTPATKGLLDIYGEAQPQLLAQQSAARAANVGDVAALGPQAMSAVRAYDPQATGLLDQLTQTASQRMALNGGLDPFTQRALQQNIRTAQAARGLGYGPGDAAQESDFLTRTREQRANENLTLAGSVAQQVGNYYGDPFMRVLGYGASNPSASVGQAQSMAPGALFNPDDPLSASITAGNQQMAAAFAPPSTMADLGQIQGHVAGDVSMAGGIMGMI